MHPQLHGDVVIFYLHGFASSARSSKAAFFAARLQELSMELRTPDFNEPDFSTLTISRMVNQVLAEIDAHPGDRCVLIGSSLGAFVAVQVALQRPDRVGRMILLAPALDFGGNRMRSLGDVGIDEWKRMNRLNVFHYGYGRMMQVHYELYADARRHDCVNAPLSMPIQVFQGRADTAVDPDSVERWAAVRPNVELHMLDDDHQLTASLSYIWSEAKRFLTSKSPSSERERPHASGS
jgi:pimeloyl-ACP methyl ester carboxylesterase